jgi:general secretion pathway protein M
VKQWFQQFNQREQALLLAAAGFIVLYLLLIAVWRPVSGMRDEMLQRNESIAAALGRVQLMAAELKQLQGGGGGKRANRNLNQLINNSTASYSLRPSRIQPNSRGELQIRFEDASFENLLRWLNQLEQEEGLLLVDVSLTQGERGGLVNANIRIGQGAG